MQGALRDTVFDESSGKFTLQRITYTRTEEMYGFFFQRAQVGSFMEIHFLFVAQPQGERSHWIALAH